MFVGLSDQKLESLVCMCDSRSLYARCALVHLFVSCSFEVLLHQKPRDVLCVAVPSAEASGRLSRWIQRTPPPPPNIRASIFPGKNVDYLGEMFTILWN